MATQVELTKEQIKRALEKELASLRRSIATHPIAKDVIEKEMAQIQTAINTMK